MFVWQNGKPIESQKFYRVQKIMFAGNRCLKTWEEFEGETLGVDLKRQSTSQILRNKRSVQFFVPKNIRKRKEIVFSKVRPFFSSPNHQTWNHSDCQNWNKHSSVQPKQRQHHFRWSRGQQLNQLLAMDRLGTYSGVDLRFLDALSTPT